MLLKKIRQNKGLSLKEASKQLNISESALGRYEAKQVFPKKVYLKKIQRKYNLTNEEISNLYLDYFLNKKES